MTLIAPLVNALYIRVKFQNVPGDINEEDLYLIIKDAIRYLYINTGRSGSYSDDLYTSVNGILVSFDTTLLADEIEYVLVTGQIAFYRMVQASVNNIVGYTTDALSVTNADKPYQYLNNTINTLLEEQKSIYFKMMRYGVLASATS